MLIAKAACLGQNGHMTVLPQATEIVGMKVITVSDAESR